MVLQRLVFYRIITRAIRSIAVERDRVETRSAKPIDRRPIVPRAFHFVAVDADFSPTLNGHETAAVHASSIFCIMEFVIVDDNKYADLS